MGTVVTVTNGGGSEHDIVVSGSTGQQTYRIVPGSTSVSLEVPEGAGLRITQQEAPPEARGDEKKAEPQHDNRYTSRHR